MIIENILISALSDFFLYYFSIVGVPSVLVHVQVELDTDGNTLK